ncbi:MAG: ROK family transcriptional regulator, partial [Bacteroidales bacterium]|nr:ROK family transcriptional regulator [Bacteroidales bacterium]
MLTSQILKYLSDTEKAFISQIAQGVGLSVPTTTKYLEKLEKDGLVRKSGKVEVSHGRRPVQYRLNEDAAYFIGVDPKKNTLEISICDLTGKIVREFKEDIPFENTPEMMEHICSRCDNMMVESGIDPEKIKTVAFNLSGRVNPKTGFSHTVFNFESQDEPLAEILSQRLSRKVLVENDTRAMAYGELHSVIKNRYKDFLFINIGWGIGLSIIIDGKPYYGMNGYSGEFGHTNAYDNEIMCHCGKKGCLETVVSG